MRPSGCVQFVQIENPVTSLVPYHPPSSTPSYMIACGIGFTSWYKSVGNSTSSLLQSWFIISKACMCINCNKICANCNSLHTLPHWTSLSLTVSKPYRSYLIFLYIQLHNACTCWTWALQWTWSCMSLNYVYIYSCIRS